MNLADSVSAQEINEQLDQAASLGIMNANMTLEEVADEVALSSGRRPAIATLSRLQNGIRVRPVFGLRETEIDWTFYTATRIARDAQLEELKLRVAKWAGEALEPGLVRAHKTVRDLRCRLRSYERLSLKDLDRGERLMDRAAVDSLDQQVQLYRAGLARHDEEQLSRFARKALEFGVDALGSAGELLEIGDLAGQIVCSRVAINSFFASYLLDQSAGQGAELPRSRAFAGRYGTASMFDAAFRCASATRDPRLAHYFAELAVLRPRGSHKPNAPPRLSHERHSVDPIETAARLLVMSKKLDRAEHTPIRDWKPRWLEARIPQLEAALLVVEKAEQA